MLSGGTRYKCFQAWAIEARTQREERDAVLRQALLRNGAMMEVKVVRAWFDWRTTRLAGKRRVVWRISPAGTAFRAWQMLIDAKRRREFLDWALGPEMSLITGKLKAATKTLSDDLGAQIEGVRESVTSLQTRLKQEVAVERKAVREALERKVDIVEVEAAKGQIEETKEEIDVLREQLGSEAEGLVGVGGVGDEGAPGRRIEVLQDPARCTTGGGAPSTRSAPALRFATPGPSLCLSYLSLFVGLKCERLSVSLFSHTSCKQPVPRSGTRCSRISARSR